VVSFAAALAGAPFVAPDLLDHFYAPQVLGLTHMLTLGWITMTMMGVLYRYVPALVKRPLPRPGIAIAQWVTFVAGVTALVASFFAGWWYLTVAAAASIVVSIVLLVSWLWPLLAGGGKRGVAEIGIFAASCSLLAAAALGFLLALHKIQPFLGGGFFTNLGAHVALAAVGWVGIAACALSFRFLPAFLLPALDRVAAARVQVIALTLLVPFLAVALLARSALVLPAVAGVTLALAAHVWLLWRMIASHRMPLDWTAWHAVSGGAWCLVAVSGGALVAWIGAQDEIGARLAAAYALAGLLGWLSNLIVGVSYKLFPAFVVAARTELRRAIVPLSSLGAPEALKPMVFGLFNAGVACEVAGLVLASGWLVVVGAMALTVAGLLYGAVTLRTLAFVLSDPPPSDDPLTVLPDAFPR
jgi:hypothetical protein